MLIKTLIFGAILLVPLACWAIPEGIKDWKESKARKQKRQSAGPTMWQGL